MIQNAINETFSADVRLRFETAPDVVSGIELSANGQKVAWSIADNLASLEQSVTDLLKEKDKADTKVELESKNEVRPGPKPKPEANPAPETRAQPDASSKPAPETDPQPERRADERGA